MTVRLRAHHLLCMLTYVGEGYSKAFTANYDLIVARLTRGEDILLVAGPDDVCSPLLGDAEPHCHRESVEERDRLAALAASRLLGREVAPGISLTLSPAQIAQMRQAFRAGTSRAACADCEWSALCTRIAAADYPGARLEAP